jgi:general secretion pathway protein L
MGSNMLSKSSLGISFWDNRVDIFHLRQSFGKTVVVNSFSMPFTYGMKREEFEGGISGFIKENHLQGMMPYVAIPRKDVLLLKIELPVAVEENLREVIGHELDNYTPFTADTAYFDFKSLGHTIDGSKVKILLGVIEKERLNYYINLLKIGGLEPISIEISSTAAVKTISDDNLADGKNAILYMGSNICELSLYSKGNLEYSRSFDKKGQIIDAIQKEYKRIFSYGIDEYEIDEIKKVLILGNGACSKEFTEEIAGITGREAVKVEAFRGIDIRDGLDIQLQRSAIGCGLRGLNGDAAAINLLPARTDRDKTPRSLRFTAIILFIVLLSLLGGEFAMRVNKEAKIINQLKEKIVLLERSAVALEKLEKETEVAEGRLPQINNFNKRKGLFLSILKELTDIIPTNTYLTTLKYHDNEIEIAGRSASAVSLLPLLEASPLFKDVEFSATVKRREAVKERPGGGAVILERKSLTSIGEEAYLENFSIKAKLEGL